MPAPAILELQSLALLRDLPPEELSTLSKMIRVQTFARRAVVLHKNETGQALCFLMEGRLQGVDFTLDGREVGLFFVEQGDYFGELAVIDEQPQAEFVIAMTRSRVAMLPRDAAHRLMFSSPGIAEQVAQRLAARLRAVASQRTILRLPSVFQRVCAQLLQMATADTDGMPRISNAPTHQEIAIMIDTSRETVTRAMQTLLSESIVSRHGPDLLLHDEDYLRGIAEGSRPPARMG